MSLEFPLLDEKTMIIIVYLLENEQEEQLWPNYLLAESLGAAHKSAIQRRLFETLIKAAKKDKFMNVSPFFGHFNLK